MSFTLRGRLETRLAATLVPLVAAALAAVAIGEWWPLALAALMLGVGVAFDILVWHAALPYQAAWVALPLAVVELAAVMGVARVAGIDAPLPVALALFWGAWLLAQLLGHVAFPRVRLSYAEDGGELGRLGAAVAAAVLVVLSVAGGVAWATRPPTVHLDARVHRGPLVLDRAQTLVGGPGAIVEGGIVIRADDVTVRDVTVRGGEHGFDIEGAERVVLEDVVVEGAQADGIHARQSSVTIRRCVVRGLAPTHTQAIDISFAGMLPESRVEDCLVEGAAEGIATQMAHVEVRGNVIRDTSVRGISLNEMSMGLVEENDVTNALGIGILCMDYSHCEIRENRVSGTRADVVSQSKSRAGYAIVAHYNSFAELDRNELVGNARDVGSFVSSTISPP